MSTNTDPSLSLHDNPVLAAARRVKEAVDRVDHESAWHPEREIKASSRIFPARTAVANPA
jgi:hypothetical protein